MEYLADSNAEVRRALVEAIQHVSSTQWGEFTVPAAWERVYVQSVVPVCGRPRSVLWDADMGGDVHSAQPNVALDAFRIANLMAWRSERVRFDNRVAVYTYRKPSIVRAIASIFSDK